MSYESIADHDYALGIGRERPQCAWVLSDRDVWYQNPFYDGPHMPHPEADFDSPEEFEAEVFRLNAESSRHDFVGPREYVEPCDLWGDDIPF